MVSIEAFDELLAVYILLVCRASIPEMGMPIDDENFFTLGCPVHGVSPAPARIECYEARRRRSRIGLAGTNTGQALFEAVSNNVFHHLVHVAEQHDGIIIRHDHAAIMRRG